MLKALIVSDSLLLVSALRVSISAGLTSVKGLWRIESVFHEDDLENTVIIIDAGNVADVVKNILDNRDALDLSRVIVLLRTNHDIALLKPIIGVVGAILPDDTSTDEINLVVKIVRQGLTLMPSSVITAMGMQPAATEAESSVLGLFSLSGREESVLGLISEGASNKVIARKLDICEGTVRVHVRSILKKLGFQNRTQAALYAMRKK